MGLGKVVMPVAAYKTGRKTDRQTDRQAGRQAGGQAAHFRHAAMTALIGDQRQGQCSR